MNSDRDEEEEEFQFEEEEDEDEEGKAYATELAGRADLLQNPLDLTSTKTLPPLIIDKTAHINKSKYTYENIVRMLTPIVNLSIPLSEMAVGNRYKIVAIGTTSPDIWQQVGLKNKPTIGTVFRSISVPPVHADEAIVYKLGEECMSVHEKAEGLILQDIMLVFMEIVGMDKTIAETNLVIGSARKQQTILEKCVIYFYNYVIYILGKHNADESDEAWTEVFDNLEKRKQLVKHAAFHSQEGHINNPNFFSYPDQLIIIVMFIKTLPLQVQVSWAQHYMQEFIEGYGQKIAEFNPTRRMPMGFIATCFNGNFEKVLLSLSSAITHFYIPEIEIESEEKKYKTLKNELTGSLFNEYYKSFANKGKEATPTLEDYIDYIKKNIRNEDKKAQMLALVDEPTIRGQLIQNLSYYGGKKMKKTLKKKKYLNKKKTLKKTLKKKKYLKKTSLKKKKKTRMSWKL